MNEMLNAARLVPLKEACRYARFSRAKAYRLIDAEKITAYKRDRLVMIDLNTIDAYYASLPQVRSKRRPGALKK